MEWYLKVVRDNYANFNGRARRKEYWMFVLFNMIISFGLGLIGGLTGITMLSNIYALAVLIPSIAVAIRRMHDVGKSGWFILIPIYSIILLVTDSESGENKWGPNPKKVDGSFDSGDITLDENV